LPFRKDSTAIAALTAPSENPNSPSFFGIEDIDPYQMNGQTLGDIKVDGNIIVQLFAQ